MKKTILHIGALLICSALLGSSAAYSDVPESETEEVQHLLEFVQTTDCVFERNGKKHSAEEAREHIERKYKHFRGKITTTEEFIELSATKSTLSGKEYLVYCGTQGAKTSKQWLLDELTSYRENTGR